MSADLIERLECGHPRELAVTSAETGAFLYCELCDCRQRRNDAETMGDHYRERAERAEQEVAKLKTVMVAAAEEIHEHWDAHCDAEGYGPANLMRRLEEGIPSEYGYTAGAFAELNQRATRLERLLEAVEPMMAALGYHGQMSARGDLVSKVMDALYALDAEAS